MSLFSLYVCDLFAHFFFFSNPTLHSKAVDIVRSLLSWHDSDARYQSPEARRRVAALYLPLLSIAMDVLPLLHHWSSDKNDRYSVEESSSSNINESVALAIAGKISTVGYDGFTMVMITRIYHNMAAFIRQY